MIKIIKLFLILGFIFPAVPKAQDIPITGTEVPQFKNLEVIFSEFLNKWNIPGGQLAIAKDGRLVFNRGFGYSDKENLIPVQTDNIFRIGSCSKTVTACAIMKLIEDGKLSLTDKAFDILDLKLQEGVIPDPRYKDITIQMLLEHSAGFEGNGNDVFLYMWEAADALGVPRPANSEQVLTYIQKFPLSYTPGTKYSYSNTGYTTLGLVIEKVSGIPYEQFVKENVLSVAGIGNMRLGMNLLNQKNPEEVFYYSYDDEFPTMSFEDSFNEAVMLQYGGALGNNIRLSFSSGGWLASASDLVRLLTSLDYTTNRPHFVSKETVELMTSPPLSGQRFPEGSYYAKGVVVDPSINSWDHQGALIGSSSLAMRIGNSGVTIAFVINFLPYRELSKYVREAKFELVPMLINSVTDWPSNDMFE